MTDETRQSPTQTVSHEASPTEMVWFLLGVLHNLLVHIDTLPLDDYFAAAHSGNQFVLVLEKIDGEVSAALSVAGANSIFEQLNTSHRPEGR